MIRKLATALAFALAFSACSSCDEPKPTPLDTRVSLTAPADGATLTLRDDVASGMAGLQIDVRGTASGFGDDATATLQLDGNDTGLQVPVGGTSFAFLGVTLEAGARVLSVTVSGNGATGTAMAAVVVDDDPLPDSLEIVPPAHGSTLNAAADASSVEPGLQTEVVVKSVMLTGGKLRLCLATEGFTGTGACKQAQGQILAESELAANGTTILEVTLPEGLEQPLAAEWEKEGAELVVALPISVSVDTVAPALSFAVPVEGETRTEQSFDVLLQTDAEEGQVATVTSSALEGEQFVGAVDSEGKITVHVTLPVGAQTLTALVADKAGNSAAEATVGFTVDVAGCDVQLSDPAGSNFVFNTLNSTVNGTAGTYTLRGQTTACPGGTVRFTKTVNGVATVLGATTAAEDGTFSYAATFQDGEKDATLNVKVEGNLAPNAGLDLAYTADFASPVVAFVSPVEGSVVTSQATALQISVTGAEQGQLVTFKSGSTEIGTAMLDSAGQASLDANLALGAQVLSAALTDAAGNPGSASVNVVVDIAGCDVTLTNPTTADFVFNLANTTAAAAGRTFAVTGTTSRCGGGLARFFKTVGGTTTELGTATVDAGGAFSYAAAFADGEANGTLNVRVDKGLAPNAGVSFSYRADFTAPSLVFTAPTDGATVTSLATTLEVQVTGAEQDQVVTFKAGGTTVGSGAVDAAGHASAAANLSLGEQTLSAEVADTAGNPASTSIHVVVDTDGCDVVLTNPTASDYVFNLANTTAVASGRTFAVAGRTTRCAGGTARFTRTAGGNSSEIGTTTVQADGTFSLALPLADGDSGVSVNVKVEKNLAPNAGVSFTYRADFTAPTIAFTSPTDGQTVTSLTPALEVATTGAEQDQMVTFKAGGSTIGSGAVSATGAASASVNLTVGSKTLTAEVADAAGNPASASIQVLVDTAGCDVALTNPAAAEMIFNLANATVTAGTPKTGSYTLTGATTLCANGTARFTKTVGGVTTELGTAPVEADGTFSYAATFVDGESDATLNVKVEKNLAPNAGIDLSYSADFTAPSLDVASPVVGDLYVVHAANTRLQAGEAGFVADADPATAGGQLDLALTVSGVGTIGSTGNGRVVIALGSSELFNQAYAANAQQAIAQRFTLPEGYNGPMTASLTDAAGNTASGAWNVRVATVALPTPTIALPTAGTINVFRDLGGDRATYASVQGNVNFSAAAPAGTRVRVCSTVQFAGAAACAQAGYYELPNTVMTASGTGQFYASLRLPQGVQTISAELADTAGSLAASAAVALTVDTVPPVVTSFASVDDANHDGLLTGTELPSGQPSHFTAKVTGAEGRQISLWDGSNKLAAVNVASGSASFTVTSLADGLHALKVLVTDAANNPNESTSVSPAISNPAASLALTVKRVAPSIAVVAPSFAMCNLALDKEKATEDCDVDFTVAVSAGATRVDFSGPGSPVAASVTSFTNSRATATYTLGQGGPFALVATVYDSAGNSRQATVNLSVDTIAPTLAFTSPTDGELFTSQNIPVVLATNAEAGRTVKVTSSLNGAEVGSGAVAAGGTASFTVRVPYGSQSLNATVSDLAGNPASAAPVAIGIDLAGCDINFTNPVAADVVFNKASMPASGVVTIIGNSLRGDCPGQTITFYAAVNGGPESLIGTRTIDTNGNFSIDYSFGDGTVTVFTAETTYNTTNRSSFTATTDLTPPTLTINSPVPSSQNKLFVVAQTGNINVRDGVVGYLADADAAPDGQVNFNLTVVGGGSFDGSANGRVVVMQGATEVASQVISSNGTVTVNPLAATLEQAFVGTLTVMVTDSAGNSAGANWDLTVDVVPPEAPTFVTTDPGDGNYTRVIDQRHADIDVWIAAAGDDGPAGQTLDWALGWSTGTRLGTSAFDLTNFDNATMTTIVDLPAPAGSAAQLAQLRSLPPLNTISAGAVMLDQIGNRSQLAPVSLDASWSRISIPFPGTSSTAASFGVRLAAGDVDGDGIADLAVSASTENGNTGSVRLFLGGKNPLTTSQFPLTGSQAGAYFGQAMDLVDVNTDGHADLLVRNGSETRLYLGGPSGLNSEPLFAFVGETIYYAKQLGDLNLDGFADFALGSSVSSGNLGKAYVFFSRADWSGVITNTQVNLSAADMTVTGSTANGYLTHGNGITAVPDIDGDGRAEILLGAFVINKAFLFTSTTLFATPTATTAQASFTFSGASGSRFGYSGAAVDANGDGLLDIVFGTPGTASISAATRQSDGTFGTPTWFASYNEFFGWSLAVDDLNADSKPDLFVGSNSTAANNLTAFWSTPAGLTTPAGSRVLGGSTFSQAIATGDFNGDGRADIAIGEYTNANGNVYIRY